MALLYAMAMAHRLSSCGGNDMDEKKSAPAEIETVTITMSRPVAEAMAKACEMYLRLHLGQFEDLIDELCMAKFYAALENDSFADEEERDEIFHISIDRRNIMQEEVDKLYKRYVLSAPLDYCMRIPYRAEQVWLAIRHAMARQPEGRLHGSVRQATQPFGSAAADGAAVRGTHRGKVCL